MSFRGERRRPTLAKRRFAIGAGEMERLRLRLSNAKVNLVRSKRTARAVRAIARVADQAGNAAKMAKRMELAP